MPLLCLDDFKDLGVYLNQVSFIFCACLGGIAHYFKKVAKKETTASFRGWFGKNNLPATIYTFLVFIFIIIGALAGDIINSQTGFWATLYTGFATGFAIDAGVNSDASLTSQLIEVKNETKELMSKDNDTPRPRYAGRSGYTRGTTLAHRDTNEMRDIDFARSRASADANSHSDDTTAGSKVRLKRVTL